MPQAYILILRETCLIYLCIHTTDIYTYNIYLYIEYVYKFCYETTKKLSVHAKQKCNYYKYEIISLHSTVCMYMYIYICNVYIMVDIYASIVHFPMPLLWTCTL